MPRSSDSSPIAIRENPDGSRCDRRPGNSPLPRWAATCRHATLSFLPAAQSDQMPPPGLAPRAAPRTGPRRAKLYESGSSGREKYLQWSKTLRVRFPAWVKSTLFLKFTALKIIARSQLPPRFSACSVQAKAQGFALIVPGTQRERTFR
jgi:hypothetical protein